MRLTRRLTRTVAAVAGVMALVKWLPRTRIDLSGRVVLITGGARGLGVILARQFGAAGAKLAICGRDESELARANEELEGRGYEVFAMLCDVADPEEVNQLVEQVVDQFGRLDLVVNNAGIIQVGPLEAMGLRDFHEAMNNNFWGAVHVTLAAVPYLRLSKGSRIVNVTSIGGAVAVPHLLPYSAAKFAEVGFSTGLRAELAKDGIGVITVLPGLMRTGSFINAWVKGRRDAETSWFSLGASLPGISMSATRAASQIVRACERGDSFITLGLPAKVARIVSALMPNLTLPLMALVSQALPKAPLGEASRPSSRAGQHRRGAAASVVTILGDRAADANKERPAVSPDDLH
jgi:NAD(P)-dependent dehydrogenase (short-subunit alcohol dehydrogenase family)